MVDDVKMLQSITEAADMSRDSLKNVMEKATDTKLKSALQKQIKEYDGVYNEAERLLKSKGKKAQKSGAVLKSYSHIVSNAKAMAAANTTSKIAEMVVQGSTMGITALTKELNDYRGSDKAVKDLAEKHVLMEELYIDEMKKYL